MKKPLLTTVLMLSACTAHSDCDQAKALFEQAGQAKDTEQKIGLYEQALSACEAIDAHSGLGFAIYYELGRTQLDSHQFDQAMLAFKQAYELAVVGSEQEVKALAQIARIHFDQQNLLQAGDYINKAHQVSVLNHVAMPDWANKLRQAIDLTNSDSQRIVSAQEIHTALAPASCDHTDSSSCREFGVTPKLELNTVTFKYDSTELTEQGQRQLRELGKGLTSRFAENENSSKGANAIARQEAILVGHTDKQGTPEYNQNLSERRAETIKQQLLADFPALKGTLTTQGKGETALKYCGDNEMDHRRNRRVELVIGSKAPAYRSECSKG